MNGDSGTEDAMDIDRFFMGTASQITEREYHFIVEDLRGILIKQILVV